MEQTLHNARLVRFGIFEVDLHAGELRKGGVKLKLSGLPFQVLAILLECPGEIVTRDELQRRLWPNTFVDVDHNLNTAINKVREVLGDSSENPRFVETVPRRGYRFLASVETAKPTTSPTPADAVRKTRAWLPRLAVLLGGLVIIVAAVIFFFQRNRAPAPVAQRSLTRLTFDDGLQIGATWSPDSRFIAYSSNRGGKFDIWVQQLTGGDPVQITKGQGQNWQPEWSPDGKYIAYRSEAGDGGLFIVPSLGGVGMERKITSFGYYPRWSPDSSQILFQSTQFAWANRIFVVNLDGAAPSEILRQLAIDHHVSVRSAAWHPDGKRISALINSEAMPVFWTVPIVGGTAIKSEAPPELLKQIEEVSADDKSMCAYEHEWAADFRFAWAPSGTAIYYERTFRGARNIWSMTVDPETLRTLAVERVTTGPGLNSELSLSPDGRRLAFTDQSQQVRTWLFPFDAANGKLMGPGQPVTPSGVGAYLHDLSQDGSRFVYSSVRSGKWQLREQSLPDGLGALVVPDDSYRRDYAKWSPDAKRLAYTRRDSLTGETQVVEWSGQDRGEYPLTTLGYTNRALFDWSRQGDSLLVAQTNTHTDRSEIAVLPVLRGARARSVISDPAYDLYQARYSPDNRWIVFEAIPSNTSQNPEAAVVFVSPAAGGPWIRITDGTHWDDKPYWSPDGKIIYFVSGRDGFFNVWGIHFDQVAGKPEGDPFAVTSLSSPSEMVPQFIPTVSLSLSRNRLALTVTQVSGNIWVLDHIAR